MRTLLKFLTICALATAAAANPVATMTIHTEPTPQRFEVEIADTPAARSRGLMHRHSLPEDAGMLFIFEQAAEVAFWMRNTYIPLDLLFIDGDGRIVRIHPNARPHDDTLLGSGQPIRYVLEINGGLAARLGIETGQRTTLDWSQQTD